MTKTAALLLALSIAGCAAPPASVSSSAESRSGVVAPETPAQACDYRCTSSYDEVMDHLRAVTEADPALHLGTFGESVEGRPLPLVVFGADGPTTEAVRAADKARVLVFANIHAGEVAGKDGMLELLSDLVEGQHREWADSLVVMIAPIYNADGNERMGYDNRPLQDGPVEGMGERRNAQGLDLNRDFVKLAAPESRALVALIRDADPHVVVDLHTTNGTRMGYHLTYAPGLHPDTPRAIDRDLWDRWLPAISDSLLASDDFATYHYGNVPGAFGEEAQAPRGWYSYGAGPRYVVNNVGLRGRYAILSEAYSYAPYAERVAVSRRFAEEILDQAWSESTHIRRTVTEADAQYVVGQSVAVRSTWEALPDPVEILLGEVDSLRHPVTDALVLRRRNVRRPETIPAYVRFVGSETVTAPQAYVVRPGPHQGAVRDLLDLHGIEYSADMLRGRATEHFLVDSMTVAPRPYEGVQLREVSGQWYPSPPSSSPAGEASLIVPVDQPLGRLAVVLLEPRSDDGVIAWGIVPDLVELPGGGRSVPIERIP